MIINVKWNECVIQLESLNMNHVFLPIKRIRTWIWFINKIKWNNSLIISETNIQLVEVQKYKNEWNPNSN